MNFTKLQPLGWSNYFLQQIDFDNIDHQQAFRISAIHRSTIKGIGENGEQTLLCPQEFFPTSQFIAVGDWVLVEKANEHLKIVQVLSAQNRIERLSNQHLQLIAANIDYLFIVTSANDEFNLKRLERYLAMAYEFDIEPVIVLSKSDLTADKQDYLDQISSLNVSFVHAISMEQPDSLKELDSYLTAGTTLTFVGSSGVGKSTLINRLYGEDAVMHTQTIREDDDKGKHTTTHRQLLVNKNDVIFIDTPGMRELGLLDATHGLDVTFESIVALAEQCKFNDCSHVNEPGCKVLAALESGELEQAQFDNYQKLLKEDEYFKRKELGAFAQNQHFKAFSKMVKTHKRER